MAEMLYVKHLITELYVCVQMVIAVMPNGVVQLTNAQSIQTANLTNVVIVKELAEIPVWKLERAVQMHNAELSTEKHNVLVHRIILVIQGLNVRSAEVMNVSEIHAERTLDAEIFLVDLNVVVLQDVLVIRTEGVYVMDS